jgi:hypothetical protein
MNPYLEQADVWTDFHARLVPAIADALAAQLDPDYIVKIQEQLSICEPPAACRLLELAEVSVERISQVEVRDRRKRNLATVIEVLSPATKSPGWDRERYLSARRHLLGGAVHLVEIDLLRGGLRVSLGGTMPGCDYCMLVRRADRPWAELWPWRLRDPLPQIPVPLQPSHPDAKLDLQGLLHRVYDAARYQSYIYEGTPSPALSPEDAAWAEEILKAARP